MKTNALLDPRSIEVIQHIPPMTLSNIAKVRELEAVALSVPQVKTTTQHILHGSMYARTVLLKKGVMLTGALIEIATILIVAGNAEVLVGEKSFVLDGYHVMPASAGRKQAFIAREDTQITMIFPTTAQTVEEAENWFTDEAELLFSRHADAHNIVIITGE